ncbi:hypothetical protein [Bosea rubneri]|uniref:Uncharacterized protein n=1 Tax=Bosea rubneri TaxID=3075434 RepID=A0ABU3S479_9HYPH|nr:hypothetical protein [Bosea sp. ZW T0_25]MDU0339557.1 hypothetical protein [Bosea sp. ZW T0_25]
MAYDKKLHQRRVYLLPNELVERVVAYQEMTGLSSEAEAARRLIDEALKSKDTYKTILERFRARLKDIPVLSEAAKDVIVGHPLVTKIEFMPDYIAFTLKDGFNGSIRANGYWAAFDEYNTQVEQYPPAPEEPKSGGTFGRQSKKSGLDDDIPF